MTTRTRDRYAEAGWVDPREVDELAAVLALRPSYAARAHTALVRMIASAEAAMAELDTDAPNGVDHDRLEAHLRRALTVAAAFPMVPEAVAS